MKFSIAQKCAMLLGVSVSLSAVSGAAECETIGEKVTKAVAAEPAKVLVIVDEMVSKNESCACEVVKSAITASEADKALVREIVVTAVTAAQGMAATIAECAVAAAPSAASEIKAGLSEVFAGAKSGGGKSVVYDSGYSAKGGKGVEMEEEEERDDFGPEPVVISGVYLIAPSSAAGGFGRFRDRDGNIIDQDSVDRQNRLIEVLRRRGDNRGRDSGRGGSSSSGPDPSPTDSTDK